MTPVDQTDIARAWSEQQGQDAPAHLLAEYYPRLAGDEVRRTGAPALAANAAAHLELARTYDGGRARVAIRNPEHSALDYTGNRTLIDIVVTDIRYAVASVVAELNRQGLAIRDVHHPIMAVRRGAELTIVPDAELSRAATETAALPIIGPGAATDGEEAGGIRSESWIHIEVDRVPEEDFGQVEAGLVSVLDYAEAADRDSQRMRARAREIADELRAHAPRPELAAEAAEAAELLTWMDHGFVFLGFREYAFIVDEDGKRLDPIEGTALGISSLREARSSRLSRKVAAKAEEPHVLVLTEANSRSRVMRRGYMDYVGVKTYDEDGRIVGERRFVGLWTPRIDSTSALDIPVIRTKVRNVLRRSGLGRDTHAGDELLGALESYPRDDLFHASTDEIFDTVMQVVDLQERREPRVFIRRDPYERYMSVLIYLPRDLYNTAARERVQDVLREVYSAHTVDFDVQLGDSALARLHFTARVPADQDLPATDPGEVEARLAGALRSWTEDLWEILAPAAEKNPASSAERARRWASAFPPSYTSLHTPERAVEDVARLEAAADSDRPVVAVHRRAENAALLAFYRHEPVTLTQVLPYLANLGAEVVDERPFELRPAGGTTSWIYEFGLSFDEALTDEDLETIRDGFTAAWAGLRESDDLDRLLLQELSWQRVSIIQAFAKYLRQAGFTYSDASIALAFTAHPRLTAQISEAFEIRFDPDRSFGSTAERAEAAEAVLAEAEAGLSAVTSLESDRVLRATIDTLRATQRTNAFIREDGALPQALVFKIRAEELDFLPRPRPALESWVHSPAVEGVHLRFGTVARGGLRWSDRRDDFRTEVLGLVKAQMVKNALIVPTGAKGGFFPKRLPDPAVDRDAWGAAGQAAYEVFIGALLDIADNLEYRGESTEVVTPDRVVAHDGDDYYLVVAADKGTARFSDVANRLAAERGFWLDDAFASGGSTGYDHKAMGITSRGAWTSVERHLRELGIDASADDFTVVGIGDMSGDVFGNGMRRSRHIRLVAAFDHRDIFLDPTPDAAMGFEERERLYHLPRSSWQDYDPALISAGGGVFPRSAKAIELSPEAAQALGAAPGRMTPDQLISTILTAPVDLVYNGGIGTYIKSSDESHADVGDRANDAIRVDGGQLRARVVGEGGNLGATQLGRIEAALAGVRLNTDAVDNSAGVDSSDHEVNIKLLLAALIRRGLFAADERGQVLESMTDEVAQRVLSNNYTQNLAMGEARYGSLPMTETYSRLMRYLEREADLDRTVENLPETPALRKRAQAGTGLTSPELAVLLAYVKMDAAAKMLDSAVPDEEWMAGPLRDYFPPSLLRYQEHFPDHPLRREIATAKIVNSVVDRGGISYLYRLQEETGAELPHLVRIFTVVCEVFDLDGFVADVCALDGRVAADVQATLLNEHVRLLDRASRWFVHQSPEHLDVLATIDTFREPVTRLRADLPDLLRGEDRAEYEQARRSYAGQGVPEELASRAASLLDSFALLDVVQESQRTETPPEDVAGVYYAVTDAVSGTALLDMIRDLDRSSRWSALARGALRDDYYQAIITLTDAVVRHTDTVDEPGAGTGAGGRARVRSWMAANGSALEKVLTMVSELRELQVVDQAPVSVVLRQLRGVVRTADWASEAE